MCLQGCQADASASHRTWLCKHRPGMTCEAGFSADRINTGMTNSVGFVPYQTSINCCVSARLDACISRARGCHCACKYSCANGGTKPFRQKCDDAFFAEEPLSPLCRGGYAEVNPCGSALRTWVGRKNPHTTKQRSGATGVGPWARRCNPGSLDPTNPRRGPSHTGAVGPSSRPKANRRMPGSA